jgi:mono/diheme cytochrome c family protein
MLKRMSFMSLVLLSLGACNVNHRSQSSYRPNEGNAAMTPVEGTRYQTEDQSRPSTISRADLQLGQSLYIKNCVVCHGHDGRGDSIAVRRGLTPPDSLHESKLDDKGEAYFYEVMTNGYGRMISFRRKMTSKERWLVASYVEALRLSKKMPIEELTPEDREKVQ